MTIFHASSTKRDKITEFLTYFLFSEDGKAFGKSSASFCFYRRFNFTLSLTFRPTSGMPATWTACCGDDRQKSERTRKLLGKVLKLVAPTSQQFMDRKDISSWC